MELAGGGAAAAAAAPAGRHFSRSFVL